jgi:hypothetical protein
LRDAHVERSTPHHPQAWSSSPDRPSIHRRYRSRSGGW